MSSRLIVYATFYANGQLGTRGASISAITRGVSSETQKFPALPPHLLGSILVRSAAADVILMLRLAVQGGSVSAPRGVQGKQDTRQYMVSLVTFHHFYFRQKIEISWTWTITLCRGREHMMGTTSSLPFHGRSAPPRSSLQSTTFNTKPRDMIQQSSAQRYRFIGPTVSTRRCQVPSIGQQCTILQTQLA
jgi:hypothetical protein